MIRVEFGMVLCAGLGLRLRPVTDHTPKPLLRFLDRPIAEYAVEALRNIGVGRIGVNAHHLADRVDDWLRSKEHDWSSVGDLRPQTKLVVEDSLMGTGGGAHGIWVSMGSPKSTVAVINGDVVAEIARSLILPKVPTSSRKVQQEVQKKTGRKMPKSAYKKTERPGVAKTARSRES